MTIYESDHELFRDSFRAFAEQELAPHVPEWERAGIMDRSAYLEAGKHGFIGMAVPEEFEGGGVKRLPLQRGARTKRSRVSTSAVAASG